MSEPALGKIGMCVNTVLTVFRLAGFVERGSGAYLENTVARAKLEIASMGGDWMAYWKYKIAAFYAHWRKQPLPAKPTGMSKDDDPSVIIGGSVKKWFEGLARRHDGYRRQCAIALSILESKRGFPRADDDDLVAAAVKSFTSLTTMTLDPQPREGVTSWADQDELSKNGVETTINEENFKVLLREVVQEVFKGKKYTSEDTMEPYFPSTNANYNNSRSKAGTVGDIMKDELLLKGLRADNLVKVEEVGKGEHAFVRVDASRLNERWQELFERAKVMAMNEEPVAVPVPLAEALKIRVISKGPPKTYFVLKSLQKWMWRVLFQDESNTFKLIGQEIDEFYMSDQLGPCRPDEAFLSGDYKSATDNLRGWISDYVVECICEIAEIDEDTAELFKRALTGHTIENPVTGERKPQMQGQLMGSVVSFIVLCLVNAGICKWTREVSTGRKLLLKTAKIAINGDDLTLRATKVAKRFWEALADFSGMKPSIGKCYYSSEFLHMNSAEYVVVPQTADIQTRRLSHFSRVKYINLGLVMGMKRSTKGDLKGTTVMDWGTYQSQSRNVHELKRTCPEEDWSRVYREYIRLNMDRLKATSLSWYVPEHLGGLGLPIERKDHQPSTMDLRIAAVIYNNFELPHERLNTSWKTWQYAQGRLGSMLPKKLSVSSASSSDSNAHLSEESRVLGLLCIEGIFSQRLRDLFDDSAVNSKMLGKMEELWKKAAKNQALMHSTQPFTVDALPRKAMIKTDRKFHVVAARYADVPLHVLGFSPSSSQHRDSSSIVESSMQSIWDEDDLW